MDFHQLAQNSMSALMMPLQSEGVTEGQQSEATGKEGKGLNDNNSNTHDLTKQSLEAHFHLLPRSN